MFRQIFLQLSFLIFASSCASDLKVHQEVEIVTPTVVIPVIAEIKNIDEDFQKKLKDIWQENFKEDFNNTRSVDVFVVTNRKNKNKIFGCTNNHFSTEYDSVTYVGVCKVNVPKKHSIGKISFTKDNRLSSHDYFKILNSKQLSSNLLLDFIKKSKRIPLVFVHGFNVRFEDAVLKASQISYDLKYQGPVILYSWPAGAGDGFFEDKLLTKTYEINLKNAKDSIIFFKKFLNDLKLNNLSVNLIVHSMGHQMILPALKEFSETIGNIKVINELILNAPDFEADLFLKSIEKIKEITARITLYCSYNDKAMDASESYNKSERLGACAYSDSIDSINVGLIDSPTLGFGLGHSYYSSRAILGDVFQLLLGIEADKRLFIFKSEPNSTEKFFLRE
jgi:esterase/lipase superfamily enzyme